MNKFPPENGLEMFNIHSEINLLELWTCLVLFKNQLPVLLVKGRYTTHDDIPFSNGESGTCQACNAPNNHHGENDKTT